MKSGVLAMVLSSSLDLGSELRASLSIALVQLPTAMLMKKIKSPDVEKRNFNSNFCSGNKLSHNTELLEGLLVTNLVILNHGQVTRTTPELEPLSYFHTTTKAERWSLHRFIVPLHGGPSAVLGSNSRHAGHETFTLTTKLPRPYRSQSHPSDEV
ncbi:hypothetical protein TNCV_3738731 [Trichonephila clavipes]|nr:hypothetical protein TNCV_3738731 [Trichonephila clavipes]